MPAPTTTFPTAPTTKINGNQGQRSEQASDPTMNGANANGNTSTINGATALNAVDGTETLPSVEDASSNAAPLAEATDQLTSAVDEMLKGLAERFGRVSEEMVGRMDDMSKRLDGLEAQLRSADGEAGDLKRGTGSGAEK